MVANWPDDKSPRDGDDDDEESVAARVTGGGCVDDTHRPASQLVVVPQSLAQVRAALNRRSVSALAAATAVSLRSPPTCCTERGRERERETHTHTRTLAATAH